MATDPGEFDRARHGRECRDEWTDPVLRAGAAPGERIVVRARCMTCQSYTVPVALECGAAGGDECSVRAPGKYPCPVCGQCDQYINVWIAARARHHERSKRDLIRRGFVSRDYGPLRAPWAEELPDPTPRELVIAGTAETGSVVAISSLRVGLRDVRKVRVPAGERPGEAGEELVECERCAPPFR